jgi:phthalate 4,5-dioxygenase oxygenase subunit
MLSEKDNALLTRVGPGTPMGELFRRYWLPCVTSAELPAPDCPPVRLRLLGEDLIAFRDSKGKVGILEAYCPHRRANLFWGRNEECGLRCVYHGWKFDVQGRCVDMPSEPAESTFKDKVRTKAYPAHDRAGFVWVYMGPPGREPELPQYEWTIGPDSYRVTRRWFQDSNWFQSVEGDVDTSHVSFLHRWFDTDAAPATPQFVPGYRKYVALDGAPRLTVKETPYGFVYGGRRTIAADRYYWRLTHWLAPSASQIPGSSSRSARILVPIDDYTTYSCSTFYNTERPLTEAETGVIRARGRSQADSRPIRLRDGYVIDCWAPERNRDNDYLIDRELQKTTNFSGIASGALDEDRAMTETMAPIVDRTKEHLGTTDVAIIAARRRLLRMLRDLERGVEPPGLRNGELLTTRSLDVITPHADFDTVLAEYASAMDPRARVEQ